MTEPHLENLNPFDPELFKPESVSVETRAFNDAVIKMFSTVSNWWEVGAQTVRDARARGEGPFPIAPKSERARTITIAGRSGHRVPLRVIAPDCFWQAGLAHFGGLIWPTLRR